ncbi:hypothetical protein [Companilactobacillus zhongbaensis]|uniref:hypothetical protein n=1 Tax=Companilactobacillus zhongbaensis TaxID=2486009 RepID=UPI000F7975F8|nr:hypothetical protein [Companilactobacillus zhongbaensis]
MFGVVLYQILNVLAPNFICVLSNFGFFVAKRCSIYCGNALREAVASGLETVAGTTSDKIVHSIPFLQNLLKQNSTIQLCQLKLQQSG